jgi:hypothetical protein
VLAVRRFQQLGSSAVAASTVVHVGLLSLTGLCLVVTFAASAAAVTGGRPSHHALLGGLVTVAIVVAGVVAHRTGAQERLRALVLDRLQRCVRRGRDVPYAWLEELRPGPAVVARSRDLLPPLGWATTNGRST